LFLRIPVSPLRQRWQVCLKYWYQSTRLYGITSQETVSFIETSSVSKTFLRTLHRVTKLLHSIFYTQWESRSLYWPSHWTHRSFFYKVAYSSEAMWWSSYAFF
jgi:hypothetical protein